MGATPNTSQFGDLVKGLQQLQSLFGGQSREQSQQFSTGQVADQTIAANTASTQAGLSSSSLQKDAASYGAGVARDSYRSKLAADTDQALQLQNMSRKGGGSSESFGIGAAPPSGYGIGTYGQRTDNTGAFLDWQTRQGQAIASIKQGAEAQAAGDVLRTKAQSEADLAKLAQQQTQLASDRASAEKIAATQSQSNIVGSLFGSIGNRQNHSYWS